MLVGKRVVLFEFVVEFAGVAEHEGQVLGLDFEASVLFRGVEPGGCGAVSGSQVADEVFDWIIGPGVASHP